MVSITAADLRGAGFTESEIQGILSSPTAEDRVRRLRRGRGRLLEDIHSRQQALDRLDYLIYQVRNGEQAHV